MLDGHSFSVDALPAAGKEVPCVAELLTPRSMLVPREEFSEELAEGYLAAEGLAPQDGECVVWSDTQEQIVAVMAIDRMLLDALRAKYEAGVRFTSPLLHLPKFSGNAVWMQRNGSLLYVKVYRTILRMAEVIQAENAKRSTTQARPRIGQNHRFGSAEVAQGLLQANRMRIVSGKYKGRAINPPRNLRARPTTDFAKENLFNVLDNLVDFEECDVLDLFAGTGSISYEFASRGARSVTSVEINPVHYNFIRQTAAQLGIGNMYVVKANVFLYLKSCPKQFDVIFSDAPYDLEGSERVIDLVLGGDLLREEGIFIFEHSKQHDFSEHPCFWQLRSYGSVQFSFFKKA